MKKIYKKIFAIFIASFLLLSPAQALAAHRYPTGGVNHTYHDSSVSVANNSYRSVQVKAVMHRGAMGKTVETYNGPWVNLPANVGLQIRAFWFFGFEYMKVGAESAIWVYVSDLEQDMRLVHYSTHSLGPAPKGSW